jgi:DNA-binding MarR family transcriptional regulator
MLTLLPVMNKRFLREDEVFKAEDLYPSHVQILHILARRRQMTMSEISREIHVINSNLTPLVDKLIKLGYLKRQPSKNDRRVVHISLTASGKRMVERHKQYVSELLRERFETLEDERLEALMNHIVGMNEIIEECMET